MSENYSDDWDFYMHRIRANCKMNAKLRKDLASSVSTLRKHFGTGWMPKNNPSHKILWLVRNFAYEMDVGLLVFWSNCISASEESAGFEKILKKTTNSDRFDSSIAELEIAGKLARNDCEVEFEPTVGRKIPDLVCRYEGKEIFFEVKTLANSIQTKKVCQTQRSIYNACGSMYRVGQIRKAMSAPRLEKVSDVLSKAAEEAASGMKGVEVCNKYVKMYLIPRELPEHIALGSAWLRAKWESGEIPDDSRGLSGPPDPTKPVKRIMDKIKKIVKEQQIPRDKNGILIISELPGLENVDSIRKITHMITEQVNGLENILAVVLISPKLFGEAETGTIEDENFTLLRNCLYDEIQENVVIVMNESFKPEFDSGVLKDLLAYTHR